MNIKNQFDRLEKAIVNLVKELDKVDKKQEKRFNEIIKEVKASGPRKD